MTPVDAAAILAAQRSIDARVIDLARALSLATRIETELVRLMRGELFPESDAGLEANLWFSPLVAERDALGIALVPECRDELRRELMLPDHRRALDTAWKVLARSHQPAGQPGVPPVVAIQEAISYHAIAGTEATAFAHRQQMQRELGTLFRALDDDSDGSLARWMEGALPALPDAARTSPAAIALAEKLRQRASVDVASIPRADFAASGRWISDTASTIDVGCQRRTDGIELSIPPAPGSHVLKLPRTSPLVVEVQTPRHNGWQTRPVEFPASGVHVVPDTTPGSRCRITTASGHRVGVQPAYRGVTPALATITSRVDGPADISAGTMRDIGWDTIAEAQTASPSLVNACVVIGGPAEVERALTWGVPVLVYTSRGLRPLVDVPVVTIVEHGGPVLSAEYSPDGSRIVTCGDGGTVVWDVASGDRLLGRPSEHTIRSATFSPDGRQLLIASNNGELLLWPLDSNEGGVTHAHEGRVMSAEFSPTGTLIVTASQDRTARFWRPRGTRLQARNIQLAHHAAVNHASFSPDETMVATASDDRTAGIWRVDDGSRIATLQHETGVDSAVWSPDGRSLLTADADGNAWLWDPATGARDPLPFRHHGEVHFAAFSRDGRRFAAATASGQVVLWHVASRAVIADIRHPNASESRGPILDAVVQGRLHGRLQPKGARSVVFSPDDAYLLTAGTDGRAVVWDVAAPSDHRAGGAPVQAIPADLVEKTRLTESDLQELRGQLLARDDQRLLSWSAAEARREGQTAPVAPDEPSAPDEPDRASGHDGRGALVAIIADGIDVLHETFLDEHGKSRIVAIWDQRDDSGRPPEGFAFGTLHDEPAIDGYVQRQRVPSGLGRNVDGAGTHAASIAAGRPTGEFRGGVAPGARVIAVVTTGNHERYLTDYAGALHFINGVANRLDLPVVVCVDHGVNTGAHDGRSNLETAFDEFSNGGRTGGRVIVVPAGDRGSLDGHAELTVPPDAATRLRWRSEDSGTATSVELWWPSSDTYRFRLISPADVSPLVDATAPSSSGRLGESTYRMELTRRHATNGDSQLLIEVASREPSPWHLEVVAVSTESAPIHAWIEGGRRDTLTPTRFSLPHVSSRATLIVPATANSVVAVGAALPGGKGPAEFSSHGPTRDGRQKPDVAADGVEVVGARGGTSGATVPISGTLPAAALVAGAVALVLSRAIQTGAVAPTASQIAAALRQTAPRVTEGWHPQLGYGVIDVDKFTAALANRLSA